MLASKSSTLGNEDVTPETCLLLCLSHHPTHPHAFGFPFAQVVWEGGCSPQPWRSQRSSASKAGHKGSRHLRKSLCKSQLASPRPLQGQEGRFLMTNTLAP